jgi:predicted nucleic acid-binding protein
MILVDSNILIDVLDRDPVWFEWSTEQLAEASRAGRVAINHVVVAEVAPFAGVLETFLEVVEAMGLDIEPLCNLSAYEAGTAFRAYRRRRDERSAKTILPDFLIGGHALTLACAVLTRDPRFYRTYFPTVPLITPENTQ